MSKMVKEHEKKLLTMLTTQNEVGSLMQDTNKWLPRIEGEVVRQTPVSANGDILKQQQDDIQV